MIPPRAGQSQPVTIRASGRTAQWIQCLHRRLDPAIDPSPCSLRACSWQSSVPPRYGGNRLPNTRTWRWSAPRSAGAQRLSADHPPAGRPLDRLHRPSRRHRGAEAPQPADRPAGIQRHVDPRCHRPEAPRSTSPIFPGEPGHGEAGGAQMVRVCDGKSCRKGDKSSGLPAAHRSATRRTRSGTSTDPASPSSSPCRRAACSGTHKNWWECDTGIAYLVSGAPGWRVDRMTQIYDLSRPGQARSSSAISACRASSPARPGRRRPACTARSRTARRATASISATAPTRAASCRSSIARSC